MYLRSTVLIYHHPRSFNRPLHSSITLSAMTILIGVTGHVLVCLVSTLLCLCYRWAILSLLQQPVLIDLFITHAASHCFCCFFHNPLLSSLPSPLLCCFLRLSHPRAPLDGKETVTYLLLPSQVMFSTRMCACGTYVIAGRSCPNCKKQG